MEQPQIPVQDQFSSLHSIDPPVNQCFDFFSVVTSELVKMHNSGNSAVDVRRKKIFWMVASNMKVDNHRNTKYAYTTRDRLQDVCQCLQRGGRHITYEPFRFLILKILKGLLTGKYQVLAI